MTFWSFLLLSFFIIFGADLMPDDEILPFDKESYSVLWELKHKGNLQSLIRDAIFPPPKKIVSPGIDYELLQQEHNYRKLEIIRHREELRKHREEQKRLQGNLKHYTCSVAIRLQKRLKKLIRRLNKQNKFTAKYRLYLAKVSRQSEKLMRYLNEIGKHPEKLKKCIEKQKDKPSSSEPISELFDEYWNWRLAHSPEFATLIGNKEHNDVLEHFTEERYEEDFKRCKEFKESATKLHKNAKDPNDKLNLKFFIAEVSTFIEGYPFKGFYFPISFKGGIHKEFPKLVQSPVNEKDFKDILARYKAFPSYVNQTIQMMTIAMEKNLTIHAVSLQGVVEHCKQHSSASPNDTAFYEPFMIADEVCNNEKEGDKFRNEAIDRIKKYVQPGFSRLAGFLEKKYLPATRTDIAVSSLPNIGKKFYKACLKYHTSTDLTAEEIHKLGVKEVKRIEGDMKEVIKELGLKMSLKDFKKYLKNNKDNFYNSAQEVLDHATNLNDEVFPKLSKLFNNITKTPLNIVHSPSDKFPPAIYSAGTEDGTKNATLLINNHNYATFPRYLMLSLLLHEVYPGHHLHVTYMLQRKDIPKFRKVIENRKGGQAPSLFAANTVFTEGWGMYSELLGHDLGLYKDPMDRYGQLSGEIFRAGRLVVDTGIHAMGWSMNKSINYFLEHSDFDRDFIKTEVARYVTLPGQAVSYKIGQIEIHKLRKRAEDELEDKFDIKQFHDVVLEATGPLNILKKQVNKFIKGNQ